MQSKINLLLLLLQIKMLRECFTEVPWRDPLTLRRKGNTATLAEFSSIADTALEFELNFWQHHVFQYFARHLLYAFTVDIMQQNKTSWRIDLSRPASLKEQIIAYIGGSAGSGKSQIIKALIKFSELWGRRDTIETMAFMGLAGLLIDGDSMHSNRGMSVSNGYKRSAVIDHQVGKAELTIIDEASQLPQLVLGEASLATKDIKKCKKPWGGIHCLLFGDMLQNPPVKASYIFEPATDKSTNYMKVEAALEIWKSLNFIVFLPDIMRQKEDPKFIELLERSHWAVYSQEDIDILNTRYIGNLNSESMPMAEPSPTDPDQEVFTPMATSRNKDRFHYSYHSINQNAMDLQRPVYEIMAIPQDPSQRGIIERLKYLSDEDTGKMPLLLRFIMGMYKSYQGVVPFQ